MECSNLEVKKVRATSVVFMFSNGFQSEEPLEYFMWNRNDFQYLDQIGLLSSFSEKSVKKSEKSR